MSTGVAAVSCVAELSVDDAAAMAADLPLDVEDPSVHGFGLGAVSLFVVVAGLAVFVAVCASAVAFELALPQPALAGYAPLLFAALEPHVMAGTPSRTSECIVFL